jgi:hypothetical protein
MPSPDLQLASNARDYIEGRSSFDELYLLAGELLPRLVHGPESGRTLAGAILAAELERDQRARRTAVAAALEVRERAAT